MNKGRKGAVAAKEYQDVSGSDSLVLAGLTGGHAMSHFLYQRQETDIIGHRGEGLMDFTTQSWFMMASKGVSDG